MTTAVYRGVRGFLVWILAISLTLLIVCANAKLKDEHTPHIVFYAIPLPGHANPLLAQAHVLAEKGYRVSFISADIFEKYVNANKHPRLQFIGSGRCDERTDEMETLFSRAAQSPSFSESSTMIFDWIATMHGCLFNRPRMLFEPANIARRRGDLSLGEKLESKVLSNDGSFPTSYPENVLYPVDLFVVDAATIAGVDLANLLDVPFIVNNPDLAYLLSPRTLPPLDTIPSMFSAISVHSLLANPVGLLAQRVLLPPLRLAVSAFLKFQKNAKMNEIRRVQSGLETPIDVFQHHRSRLVLQNTVFGLEYSRYVSPNVITVGPCVQDSQDLPLQDSEEVWMNSSVSPVLYISMGTIAPLSRNQTDVLLRGLIRAGVLENKIRVLWKLPTKQKAVLNTLFTEISGSSMDKYSESIRAVEWVSSQVGVLKHSSTKVFISHCGINSAHETLLYAGGRVQMLCIPMFGDQLDMAQSVADAGAGMYLSKLDMTPEQISSGIDILLGLGSRPAWQRKGQIVGEIVKAAGGTKKAVEWIELIIQTTSWKSANEGDSLVGPSSYVTVEGNSVVLKGLNASQVLIEDGPITAAYALTVNDAYLPWWQWIGFDLFAIACISFMLFKMCLSCCCRCCCACCSTNKQATPFTAEKRKAL